MMTLYPRNPILSSGGGQLTEGHCPQKLSDKIPVTAVLSSRCVVPLPDLNVRHHGSAANRMGSSFLGIPLRRVDIVPKQ